MRAVELEMLVQNVVEARRAGRPVEDDRIEFKSDWPDRTKARQLAGSANALRGEPLVYIIGVNDQGALVDTSDVEPSTWLAEVLSGFDSEPPELVLHRTVQVGEESGSTVTALVFSTDKFPYVMPVEGKSDRREVPVRIGSGTKSANRFQLLRLLRPPVAVPTFSFAEADVTTYAALSLSNVKGADPPRQEEVHRLQVMWRASIFVEHLGPGVVTMPVRNMRARLRFGATVLAVPVYVSQLGGSVTVVRPGAEVPRPVAPQFGVYAQDNHVISTAPGEFSIYCNFNYPDPDDESTTVKLPQLRKEFHASDDVFLDVALSVVGVDRPVRLTVHMNRTDPAPTSSTPTASIARIRLGHWEMRLTDDDPWGDDPTGD